MVIFEKEEQKHNSDEMNDQTPNFLSLQYFSRWLSIILMKGVNGIGVQPSVINLFKIKF